MSSARNKLYPSQLSHTKEERQSEVHCRPFAVSNILYYVSPKIIAECKEILLGKKKNELAIFALQLATHYFKKLPKQC